MIVVDASVAVKWLAPEADSDVARRLPEQPLCAPHLIYAEVANALWAKLRRHELSPALAEAAAARIPGMPIAVVADAELAPAAFALAVRLNHAACDCFYLALALGRGTHVVTADRRFVAAADARAETRSRVRPLVPAPRLTPPAA